MQHQGGPSCVPKKAPTEPPPSRRSRLLSTSSGRCTLQLGCCSRPRMQDPALCTLKSCLLPLHTCARASSLSVRSRTLYVQYIQMAAAVHLPTKAGHVQSTDIPPDSSYSSCVFSSPSLSSPHSTADRKCDETDVTNRHPKCCPRSSGRPQIS